MGKSRGPRLFTLIEAIFRVDVTHGTGLSGSQWTSLIVALASLYVLRIRRRTPGRPTPAEPESVDQRT